MCLLSASSIQHLSLVPRSSAEFSTCVPQTGDLGRFFYTRLHRPRSLLVLLILNIRTLRDPLHAARQSLKQASRKLAFLSDK